MMGPVALAEPTAVTISTPTRVDLILGRPDWHYRAACRGMNPRLFTAVTAGSRARAVCASCPVRDTCLDAGLADVDCQGIWGGLGPYERRRERRRRNRISGSKPKPKPKVERVPDDNWAGYDSVQAKKARARRNR